MNPDKNFRMKQTIKRMLCHTLDAHERGALKRVMIQAQLTAERQQRRRQLLERADLLRQRALADLHRVLLRVGEDQFSRPVGREEVADVDLRDHGLAHVEHVARNRVGDRHARDRDGAVEFLTSWYESLRDYYMDAAIPGLSRPRVRLVVRTLYDLLGQMPTRLRARRGAS